MRLTSTTLFLGGASICTVAAVVAGLLIIGSPAKIRGQRLDKHRISDLQQISYAVRRYRTSHGKLPDQLARIEQEARGPWARIDLRDPVTKAAYEYRILDATASTYELCAVFDSASSRSVAERWDHPKGRHCFSFEVPPSVGNAMPHPKSE